MDFMNIAKSAGDIFNNVDLGDLKLDEILSDTFISNNTNLDSVKAFIERSGFDVNSIIDFKNLPVDNLNEFIKSISSFESWQEMLMKAVGGKLGSLL